MIQTLQDYATEIFQFDWPEIVQFVANDEFPQADLAHPEWGPELRERRDRLFAMEPAEFTSWLRDRQDEASLERDYTSIAYIEVIIERVELLAS